MNKKIIKLTYRELSTLTGYAPHTISSIMKGTTSKPRIDTLEALEEVLGLTNATLNIQQQKCDECHPLTDTEKRLLFLFHRIKDSSMQDYAMELLEGIADNRT